MSLYGDDNEISAMASSPDGRYLATASTDGIARIWNVWDTGLGEPVVTLQRPAQGEALPYGFAADGTLVTGADLVTSSGTDAQVTQVSALT